MPHQHQQLHGIIEQLQKQGERITQPRREVLEFLCKQSKPVSVKNIELKLPQINIVTLYRILEYFIEHNVVNELTHDPKEKFFELSDPYHEHHHHTICRKCGRVNSLKCKLEIPPLKDFTPDAHVVTVYGYCNNCS